MSPIAWPKAVPLLVLAGLLVYANCVNKIFVFDDDAWLVTAGLDDELAYLKTIEGRPLLGLTNIAMHKLGRNNPVPHHVLNVFIHLAATLTLYGLVRRSLLRPRFNGRFDGRADYLAFATALLFMLHPLQVQCVTYIIQRGESMAGLFYMLILYAMLRADEVDREASYARYRRLGWYVLALYSLVLGYLSKEIMASAPAAVILFDRIFLSKSWRDLIRRRWPYYICFFIAWGAFTFWHMMRAKASEGGIGFGMEAATPTKYALTQSGVILYYLQLCVWPRGLAIDYQGWPWWSTPREAMPELAILSGMLALTAILLLWRPAIGFVCAWFFIALAPTSSIVPIVDPVFEHRMYLSVASAACLFVFLGDWLLRVVRLRILGPYLLGSVAIALGILTILRNEEYRSRVTVWERAVARMPDSVRARTNNGQGLLMDERFDEAIPILERAIEIPSYDPTALQNLAYAHELKGNYTIYAQCHERVFYAYPDNKEHVLVYADALLMLGRWEEAAQTYKKAGELKPDVAPLHYGRAAALLGLGRDKEADEEARAASEIDPKWPDTVSDLARTIILDERKRGHPVARRSALTWASLGLQYSPSPTARQRDTLGLCHAALGDFLQAGAQSITALEAKPDSMWTSLHRDRLKLYEQHRTPWPEK